MDLLLCLTAQIKNLLKNNSKFIQRAKGLILKYNNQLKEAGYEKRNSFEWYVL